MKLTEQLDHISGSTAHVLPSWPGARITQLRKKSELALYRSQGRASLMAGCFSGMGPSF